MPWFDVSEGLRTAERLALALDLRFSYSSGNVTYMGTGRTRNLSGGGVCFEFDQELRGKPDLELRIALPSRLQSVCDLELVVRGTLVRKHGDVAVLRTESYEVQTCGNRSFSQAANRGVTCNVCM
jgi:hypothetical protein